MCVGYEKPFGRGKILHLGIEPNGEILFGVLDYFNIPMYSRSKTPTVKTALLRGTGAGKHFLALVHNGNEDKTAVIELSSFSKGANGAKNTRKYTIRNLFSGKLEAEFSSASPLVNLSVRRKDGCLYSIEPA